MRGPDDDAPHYVAVHEDITDRKRAEERIRYLSNYDTLTRLPNRTLFRDRLNQAVQQAHWTGGTVAVLFMDLTQFSRVNDTLGHDLGDQILMTVGSRINAAVADEVDVVARMGGDEFALIQGGHHGTEAAAGLARRLARIIQTPVEIGDQSVSLRATIGIAMYPEDGTNPDNLIKNADLAMHRASRAEGEPYCFFSTEMNNEAQTRLNLEGDLRRALERAELVNFYQPQYDMNGSLVGMEALVRWRHPTRGLVPPGQFIPAAEDSGLIGPLGDMVLRNAASDIARWRGLGLPAIPVAVNISAVQFRDAGLVKRILSVLDDHGLGPDAIDLELTESILMGEQAGAVSFLNQLAAEGFRIAIDDFGTGYSSLSYLKRFPVHKLKIDQSFVQHLHEDTNDAILVRAIINLGHSLAMTVVAEGVETEDQFTYLRDEGADVVQGYLFSKPVPSEEMESLLRVESGHLEIAPGSGTR
jgi:diguanylate cyclase (GGDEF)-like protein